MKFLEVEMGSNDHFREAIRRMDAADELIRKRVLDARLIVEVKAGLDALKKVLGSMDQINQVNEWIYLKRSLSKMDHAALLLNSRMPEKSSRGIRKAKQEVALQTMERAYKIILEIYEKYDPKIQNDLSESLLEMKPSESLDVMNFYDQALSLPVGYRFDERSGDETFDYRVDQTNDFFYKGIWMPILDWLDRIEGITREDLTKADEALGEVSVALGEISEEIRNDMVSHGQWHWLALAGTALNRVQFVLVALRKIEVSGALVGRTERIQEAAETLEDVRRKTLFIFQSIVSPLSTVLPNEPAAPLLAEEADKDIKEAINRIMAQAVRLDGDLRIELLQSIKALRTARKALRQLSGARLAAVSAPQKSWDERQILRAIKNFIGEFNPSEEGGFFWTLERKAGRASLPFKESVKTWLRIRRLKRQMQVLAGGQSLKDYGFTEVFQASWDVKSLGQFLKLGERMVARKVSPRLAFKYGVQKVNIEVLQGDIKIERSRYERDKELFRPFFIVNDQEQIRRKPSRKSVSISLSTRLGGLEVLFRHLDRALKTKGVSEASVDFSAFSFEVDVNDIRLDDKLKPKNLGPDIRDYAAALKKIGTWDDLVRWSLIFWFAQNRNITVVYIAPL